MTLLALAVLIAAAVWALIIYNRLVGLGNRAAGAWSDIDVQLQRRHDLVGNLVETVKGYVRHERETLEQVTLARTDAEKARGLGRPGRAGEAETTLASRIRHLFVVVEAYPELLASERFMDLHRSLVDVENDIQDARRYYNAVVRDNNTRVQSVPDLLIARPLGFPEREFFALTDGVAGAPPRVSFQAERQR